MRILLKLLVVGFMLLIFVVAEAIEEEKPQWKGKIEYVNGVKVIKNPKDPLYGEISFELEEDLSIGNEEDENYMFYEIQDLEIDSQGNILVMDFKNFRIQKFDAKGHFLKTIGRKGQGPGEFERLGQIFLDSKDNLYVNEMFKMQIFSNKGEFVRSIKIKNPIMYPGLITGGRIVAMVYNFTPKERTSDLILLDSEGKKIKTIYSCPMVRMIEIRKGNLRMGFGNPLSPFLYSCLIHEELGVYGYSSEYKLYGTNSEGKTILVIEKEESGQPFTSKERNEFIDDQFKLNRGKEKGLSKSDFQKAIKFSDFRPFFDWIMKDDKNNIYVKRTKSNINREKVMDFDLFNEKGYYLYRIKIPVELFKFSTLKIRRGKFYTLWKDTETGYEKIKRYRIKNLDQLKEYSPHL